MKNFLNFLNQIEDSFLKEIEEILTDTAFEAERIVKQNAPVKTGTLRRSINTQIDKENLIAYVGTNILYALPLEKGATITPRKAKKLWIPIGKQTQKLVEINGSIENLIKLVKSQGGFLVRSKKNKDVMLLVLNKKVIGAFALKDEVEIKPYKYFKKAFEETYPKMLKKVNKVFGG